MNEPSMDRMLRRLESLEKENRRIKRIGALALFGAVALVVMGQAEPGNVGKVIEAERFVVRDSSGSVSAVLGVIPNGNMGLEIRDKNGKAGLALSMGVSRNPALRLDGQDGKTGIALGIRSNNTPGVEFYGKDGTIVWTTP
jgi:hypothetical protein